MMNKMNESGMTLLEIVVAIAILAIIVLGTLAMFSSGFRLVTLSNWHNKSTFDTQTAVEQALFVKNTNPSALGITITFSDASTITAPGELRQSSVPVNNVSADVWFFQPKH